MVVYDEDARLTAGEHSCQSERIYFYEFVVWRLAGAPYAGLSTHHVEHASTMGLMILRHGLDLRKD